MIILRQKFQTILQFCWKILKNTVTISCGDTQSEFLIIFLLSTLSNFDFSTHRYNIWHYEPPRTLQEYPDNCPRGRLTPRLGLEFGSKLGLILGLGAARQLHPRKIAPWLRLGFGLGLVLGLGQFSSGEIVLEPIIRYDVL